jgi:DNA-binding NtrC family response regulator
MQVKILRALQEGEITRVGGNDPIKVDVRIICATNLDLAEAVRNGTFREDLFYRINVVPLRLPPLRERGDDVRLLAEHYLEKFSKEIGKDLRGFTEDALNQMRRYSWPGNVRELRNLVERAVILSRGQSVEHIDIPAPGERTNHDEIMSSLTMKEIVEEAERKYLVEILKSNNGNINDTAKSAGVNARTIHRKMRDFSLTKEEFK